MPFTSEDIAILKTERDDALTNKDFALAAEKIITLRWKSSKKNLLWCLLSFQKVLT
jgi:hypothetical protein